MQISEDGLDLIKEFEGLRLEAYRPTPDDVLTIGYGHTRGVQEGDVISEAEADMWLNDDLVWAEECIDAYVDQPLTQGQFDALCSFIFNVGCKAFKNSTLCRLINEGQLDAACQQFQRWDKQAGKTLPGLVRRREAEAAVFAS